MKKISPFLQSLINAEYYTTHYKDENNEKAYFCVNCGGNSLTQNEVNTHHKGHKVFRTKKNSNHYCYTKADILSLGETVLDVSGVCVYSINSTDVYFPKSRKAKKNEDMIGRYGCCYSCGMTIKDNAFFCSILCKLECDKSLEEVWKSMTLINLEQQVNNNNVGVSLKKKKNEKKRKRAVFGDEKGKKSGGKKGNNNNRVSLKIMHGGKTVILGENSKAKKRVVVEERKLENLTDVVRSNVADLRKKMSFRVKERKGIPRRSPFF